VSTSSTDTKKLKVDLARKYVCVREVTADGHVRFDFAVGWPELSVELVLPQAAFDEFCRGNDVRMITPAEIGPALIGEGAEP
jgi:phenol hydroxylase P0 protein